MHVGGQAGSLPGRSSGVVPQPVLAARRISQEQELVGLNKAGKNQRGVGAGVVQACALDRCATSLEVLHALALACSAC